MEERYNENFNERFAQLSFNTFNRYDSIIMKCEYSMNLKINGY